MSDGLVSLAGIVLRPMCIAIALAAHVAIAGAGEPIPVSPDAYTMADYRQARFDFERRNSIEVYERAGCRSAPWDDEAIEFLEGFLKRYISMPDEPARDELVKQGWRLIQEGCDDPLVHFARGYLLDLDDHNSVAEKHLQAAVEDFGPRGYPDLWTARAAARLARFLEAWKRPTEAEPLHLLAVESILEAIKAGEYGADEQRLLFRDLQEMLDDQLRSDVAAQLCDRLGQLEGLDRWTVDAAAGAYHVRAAWDARGSDYAATVTDEGWEGFGGHLGKARDRLTAAYEHDPTRPEAPELMITVALGGYSLPGEDERFWFDRAVAAQFDWDSAYSRMITSLKPQWGGGFHALYEFGLECKNTGRYDTMVPYRLIQALMDIAEGYGEAAYAFWREAGVYDNVREVINRMVEEPAHESYVEWYNSAGAVMSWRAGRYEDCREFMERLDYEPMEELLERAHVTKRLIADDLATFSAGGIDAIAAADLLAAEGSYREAIAAYGRAQASAGDNPQFAAVVRDRIVTAALMRDFESGGWVPLTFEQGLPGWRIRQGAWQVASPTAVKAGPKDDGLFLLCQAPFGYRWELKGRIDARKLRNDKRSNLGILFHYWDYMPYRTTHSFFIYPQRNEVVLRMRYENDTAIKASIPKKKKSEQVYELYLQVWDTEAVAILDGEIVFAGDLPMESVRSPGPLVSFAGQYNFFNGFGRFEDFEIRQLQERPASLDEHRTNAP